MTKQRFSDAFFGTRFGIRETHALDVVHQPDQTHTLSIEGLEIRLYSRLISQATPPVVLLVVEALGAAGEFVISSAFKVYTDFQPQVETLPPLELLKAIVDRFGLEFTIKSVRGSVTSKFLLKQDIPLDSSDLRSAISVPNPENHRFASEVFVKLDQGAPPIMKCAMMFVVDLTAMEGYLRSRIRW